jgi:hypothetical protein
MTIADSETGRRAGRPVRAQRLRRLVNIWLVFFYVNTDQKRGEVGDCLLSETFNEYIYIHIFVIICYI